MLKLTDLYKTKNLLNFVEHLVPDPIIMTV